MSRLKNKTIFLLKTPARCTFTKEKKFCFRFLFAAFELRNKIELHLWHACLQNLYYSTKMSFFFWNVYSWNRIDPTVLFLLNQSILSCFVCIMTMELKFVKNNNFCRVCVNSDIFSLNELHCLSKKVIRRYELLF